jgi:tetraacyldisaccharide 4'-kinase
MLPLWLTTSINTIISLRNNLAIIAVNLKTTGWPSFWKHGNRPPLWATLLSLFYCTLTTLRRFCYHRGWCKSIVAAKPILVVGNRVVGGTGKTPVIIGLVKRLQRQGLRIGIVSRGYGRIDQNLQLVNSEMSADQVGDEPLLLAKTLAVPVAVARQRNLAVAQLIHLYPDLDIIISDDGWQHLAMAATAVIEVIDIEKGYGNGCCLPAGPLRESISIVEADVVLYQGQDMQLSPSGWYHLATQIYYQLDELLPKFEDGVFALAGIGQPDRFFASLKNLGINLLSQQALADHQTIPNTLLQAQSPIIPVIMTMKDAMRCPQNVGDHCWALVVDSQFTPEMEETLDALIKRVLTHRTAGFS